MLSCVVWYSHIWYLFCVVANSSVCVWSCCFWQDSDICVLSSGLLSRAPRFHCEVVCPVVKDLVCLSELPLIPILDQSERSACGCSFFPPASRILWLSSPEFMLTGALGEI